jgi:hypothetical protein
MPWVAVGLRVEPLGIQGFDQAFMFSPSPTRQIIPSSNLQLGQAHQRGYHVLEFFFWWFSAWFVGFMLFFHFLSVLLVFIFDHRFLNIF